MMIGLALGANMMLALIMGKGKILRNAVASCHWGRVCG